ncbi:MAG: response regulator [Deltaproteobacteria bacterium]|nr:response regulator [Deltaproteobacteria bacterium]
MFSDVQDGVAVDGSKFPLTEKMVIVYKQNSTIIKQLPVGKVCCFSWDECKEKGRKGLDAGVDDYVTKPGQWRVLAARVRAILRRVKELDDSDRQPAFVGDLSKLPFVKLLQFCEVRGLTGAVRILSGNQDVQIRFEHGEMAYDDETADRVGHLIDLVDGRFEVHVTPVDFGQIAHAAAMDVDPGAKGGGGVRQWAGIRRCGSKSNSLSHGEIVRRAPQRKADPNPNGVHPPSGSHGRVCGHPRRSDHHEGGQGGTSRQ